MDFLVEMILNIFIEGWLELMTLGIPKDKLSDKKRELIRKIAVIFVGLLTIAMFIALIFGIGCITNDKNKMLGYVLVFGVIAITIMQIVFGIVRIRRKRSDDT